MFIPTWGRMRVKSVSSSLWVSPDKWWGAEAGTRSQLPFLTHEPQPGKNSSGGSHLKKESFSTLSATPRDYLKQCGKPHVLSEVMRGPSVSQMKTLFSNWQEASRGFWIGALGNLKLAQTCSRRQVQESDFKILLVELSLHFADPYLIAEWNCPSIECRKMA